MTRRHPTRLPPRPDHPERKAFHGLTLEIALVWCLVYLMTDELGIGTFPR